MCIQIKLAHYNFCIENCKDRKQNQIIFKLNSFLFKQKKQNFYFHVITRYINN